MFIHRGRIEYSESIGTTHIRKRRLNEKIDQGRKRDLP